VGRLFSSIRAKLIAILFILGVVPLVFAGVMAFRTASGALLVQAREQYGNIAGKTAQQIDGFFKDLEKDIDLLAEYPFVQLAFLQHEFGQRLDTIQRVLTDYSRKNDLFNRICLVGLDGVPIISDTHPEEEPSGYPAPEWFREALGRGRHLSEILTAGPGRTPRLIMTRPVHDFEDPEKTVGLLVFDIRLDAFTRFVSSMTIGEKGYAFLWDHKGFNIHHPDARFRFNPDLAGLGDRDFRNLLARMSRGEEGDGRYSLDGVKKTMFFTPCRMRAWSVGIAVENSGLMADILSLRRRMVTFVSVLCGLILGVSFLFVKSVTRPINRLTQGARAIGDGDLGHVIRIDSGDEFRRLAGEFNGMAARLRKSMAEIIELKTFNDDILRSVSSGIITVDRKGEVTSFNTVAGTLPGLGLQKDHGREGLPGMTAVLGILGRTLEGAGPESHLELEFPDPALEHPLVLELNTSLLRNASGEVIGAIADIRDITRRKRMEREMVRVEKLASVGELAAGMAHEIRNPLAAMKTSAQVLGRRLETDAEKMLAEGILSSIDRMNNTVTDLLNFSRPKPPCPEPCDLDRLLDPILSMLRVKLRESRIRLDLDPGEGIPRAMVDREQIRQVFLNLFLNAVKAMPGGGTLSLSAARRRTQEGLFLEVTVADTGCGIPREHMDRIFDPFFTSDPAGTGLGLPIVQRFLEKNGGSIHMDSMPGQGTRATVLLPAHKPE
jgi:signal transduction histidine kinase